MSALDDAPIIDPCERSAWRAWLEANHATATGAWLIMWRPSSGRQCLDYEAAVQEALCFGWVDSTGRPVDARRNRQYYAPRKTRSPWAATNKARVERLLAEGRMAPAGLRAIEQAKSNGSWEVLDSVERLEVPEDLKSALGARAPAAANFAAFPRSARKMQLAWIALAQRPETRAARVTTVAEAAARNERARS